MVRFTMTPGIVRALKLLQNRGQPPEPCDDADLDEPAVGKPISHGQIIEISRSLKHIDGDLQDAGFKDCVSHSLDILLRGSRVYIEPLKPKKEPTSEYKVLMARLRREEEERAYERIINPPLPAGTYSQRFQSPQADLFPTSQEDIGEEDEISYADINRQMALIINILVSIVACSVAIWLAARHWSTPSRLGLSMGGSGAVAVAEAVVYAGYIRRLKDARDKGKKEVEIKEIIQSWVIGGKEETTAHSDPISITAKESRDDSVRRRRLKDI